MAVTFYLDNKDQPKFNANISFVDNDLDEFLEEMKLCFDTPAGSVMGAMKMDGDLEEFIFKNNPDTNSIKSKIVDTIGTYSLNVDNFNLNVEVNFANGTKRDVCLISIDVNNKNNVQSKRTIKLIIS